MKCIICNNETNFYFKKHWELPFKKFLEEAEYYKCSNCGFTFSKTLFEMNTNEWEELNTKFHHFIENPERKRQGNQPPYLEQAAMLKLLTENQLIVENNMVDFGGGMGTLAKILQRYFSICLPIYDPYVRSDGNGTLVYIEKEKLTKKKVVFNSALFEHITKREDIESINNIVDDDGALIIHTVVCENIPKDPNWFYIAPPVHSALYTNKSMSILMEQLSYISSLYCPIAKCWILFRKEPAELQEKIKLIHRELQKEYLFYKKGFVDYWKGF
ncbi:MAG: methyltransferase domain-containing protein [bacterium]